MNENKCGFCLYHHSFLTVKYMKSKNCDKKNNNKESGYCKHLIKLKGHIYWSKRTGTAKLVM